MSKILHIDTRSGGDWSMDLVFAGLVQKFGHENVIDSPFKQKHREWDPESKNFDWGIERRTMSYTKHNSQIRKYSENEIVSLARRNMISYVFMDERDETFDYYRSLHLDKFSTPTIVVAGHDKFWNTSPRHVVERFGDNLKAIFMDNWLPEYSSLDKAHLMNLSVNFDHYWNVEDREKLLSEKTYDISFMGYNSHPARKFIVDHVKNRWKDLNLKLDLEETPDTIKNFISRKDYFTTIAKSKVCLNLRGAAVDGRAMRFYEIPYVGSFMASQKTSAVQLDPLMDNVHCNYFDTLGHLDSIIETMLNRPDLREEIARSGHEHVMEKHTSLARVEYMFNVING